MSIDFDLRATPFLLEHTDDWWKERGRAIRTFEHPTMPNFGLSYRKSTYLRHPRRIWNEVRSFLYQFRFMWQRARYGYSERDYGSFDHYMLNLLPEILRKFKWSYGWPGEGVTTHDGGTLATTGEWYTILERMALGLEAGKAWCNFDNHDDFYQNTPAEVRAGHQLMIDGVLISHNTTRMFSAQEVGLVFDRERWDELQERRKREFDEAFGMLQYWFFTLWD